MIIGKDLILLKSLIKWGFVLGLKLSSPNCGYLTVGRQLYNRCDGYIAQIKMVANLICSPGTWRGARLMLPIVPFILVMGMGFGAAARETGLTLWLAVFMSAVVFAGGSQFAALELWEEPVAWLALALTIFAVNARHLVMGAVLSPWLSHLPAMRQYAAVIVMSDLNWASAISAFRRGEQGDGLLIGGGLAIWVAWVVGTAAGATSSSAISDAHMFGIDAVMPAFFCTVLFDGQRKSRRWFVGLVAAASAWMATMVLPPYWVVLAGVVAGVITFVVSHER